jgi:predicted dehydrogenase
MLALEAGKHVLIEKPMATTVADCDQLIAVAAQQNLTIAVGYNLRFMTTPLRARELIAAGAIGHIRTIQFSMFCDATELSIRHVEGSRYAWYGLPESVGFLIDGLPHGIDLIRWLTGMEVKAVAGFSKTFSSDRPLVEDTTVGVMELSNGAVCTVNSSAAVPAPHPREYFRLNIIGSEGILDLDVANDLHVSDRAKGWRLVAQEPKEAVQFGNADAEEGFSGLRMISYCGQMRSFIDGLKGLPMQAGNGTDGRAGLAPALALLQSSRERRIVEVV